jgi:hypothetical protein
MDIGEAPSDPTKEGEGGEEVWPTNNIFNHLTIYLRRVTTSLRT